ncbi:ABC-F family ATP-binding cassette domain-containing protein [Spiroplasma endosymbiont of Labia minor]|uniref:ABC-F family ATP-binding cassette domain-containing protein n=1 Tax=Spiroplasma endosymbiont of Labia minor TaxID=3066305 RepID=UPI0030D0C634
MSLIFFENLTHSNGGKKLYNNATMRINKGEHIALLGANGTGKTSLLNLIVNKTIPDVGEIEVQPRIKIGYLDQHHDINQEQTVEEYLKDTFSDLYEMQDKITKIYESMALEYKEEEYIKALEYQEYLDMKGFDLIEKNIGNFISGLGIEQENYTKKLKQLSGGQIGKILLAKLLLSNSDVLLLDEPTNFLDIEQVEWLMKFLQNYENAFLIVSHDNDFINNTVNIIYAIENQQINRYVGNYEKYIELSNLRKEQYDKSVESQQNQIQKLQTYVDKNKARASTAKSAQSRQKKLDKMTILKERTELAKPNFKFKYKRPATSITIKLENLEIGYDFALTKPLNFELREGEKGIVSGYNGIGKTTFLNTITGNLQPISGKVEIGNGVIIAYFKQTEISDDLTPIEFLMRKFPNMAEQQIRQTIAKFGVKNDLMLNKMNLLSGGEQTKVRLAALSLESCSLLILDEPTNHIDVLAKESLLEAIELFEGTVLLTTHDINFQTNWANKIINFETLV